MELPKIKINDFEGPFDLLLHLIKKNQMSIYNVKIYEITNQYLNYLNEMKEMDLEITSEFIVMAATLIEIKSKNLLPKQKKQEDEEDEEDTEKKLLEKLILYKKIKNVSVFFRERYISSGEVYSKKPEVIEEKKEKVHNSTDLLKNINLLELYNMYNNLIEIYSNKQNRNNVISKRIYSDKYKIEDKLEYIKEKLQNENVNSFKELVENCECKLECIVTFLALLEMVKQRMVKVYQSDNFRNILIERRIENE